MAEDIELDAGGPDGTEDIERQADDLETAVDELRRELDDLKTEKDRLAQKIEDTEQSLIDLKRDGQNRDFIDPELDTDPDIEAGIEDGNDHFRVGIESGVVVVREGVWTHHWSHTDEGSDPYSAADDTVEQKRGSYKYAGGSPTGSGTILYADLTISDTDTREGTVTLVWDSNLPALIGTAEYGAYISDDHCVWPLAKIVGTQVELLWVGGDIVTTFGGGSAAAAESEYDGPFPISVTDAADGIYVGAGRIWAGGSGEYPGLVEPPADPITLGGAYLNFTGETFRFTTHGYLDGNGDYGIGWQIAVYPDDGSFSSAPYRPVLVAHKLTHFANNRYDPAGLPVDLIDIQGAGHCFIMLGTFNYNNGVYSNSHQDWQGSHITVPVHGYTVTSAITSPGGGEGFYDTGGGFDDPAHYVCSWYINLSVLMEELYEYVLSVVP